MREDCEQLKVLEVYKSRRNWRYIPKREFLASKVVFVRSYRGNDIRGPKHGPEKDEDRGGGADVVLSSPPPEVTDPCRLRAAFCGHSANRELYFLLDSEKEI